jgi:hypothetical protein
MFHGRGCQLLDGACESFCSLEQCTVNLRHIGELFQAPVTQFQEIESSELANLALERLTISLATLQTVLTLCPIGMDARQCPFCGIWRTVQLLQVGHMIFWLKVWFIVQRWQKWLTIR